MSSTPLNTWENTRPWDTFFIHFVTFNTMMQGKCRRIASCNPTCIELGCIYACMGGGEEGEVEEEQRKEEETEEEVRGER